jgi:hypothetical protein
MVAGVRHLGGPADYDFIVNSKVVFDGRTDIWTGATNALIECLKFPRPANQNPRLVSPDGDRVIVEQVLDGLNAPSRDSKRWLVRPAESAGIRLGTQERP